MDEYIGLDVSLKETHICVVDAGGTVVARGREATQPELLADAITRLAPSAALVVLETGGQSSWLHRELTALGIPAVIVDARRAKAALSCRMNKTDANDAEGLAQLARTGWYRRLGPARVNNDCRNAQADVEAAFRLVQKRAEVEQFLVRHEAAQRAHVRLSEVPCKRMPIPGTSGTRFR